MIKSKNMILILAAVLLVGAIAYFAFAAQTPVKSGADASSGGGMMGGDSSGSNTNLAAVTGTATPSPTSGQEISSTVAKIYRDGRDTGSIIFPIDKAPNTVEVVGTTSVFQNIKITDKYISGKWITTVYYDPKMPYKEAGDGVSSTGCHGLGIKFWNEDPNAQVLGNGIDIPIRGIPDPRKWPDGLEFKIERPPQTLGAKFIGFTCFR